MKVTSALFHRTSLELTGVYLAIIMLISLVFSVANYRLATAELDRSYIRQQEFTQHFPDDHSQFDESRDIFLQQRFNEVVIAKHNLLVKLIGINSLILIGGGFLSYYLARRSLQPIEQAHEAQSRFTADASHELRTPLTVMQTENEVALMNPRLNLDGAKKQLKSNLEELAKLSALSEGLLQLAQIGENEIVKEPVSIKAVVEEAIARVMANAQNKRIELKFKPKTDIHVQGDRVNLTEAVVTLLENAVKFSSKNSEVFITISKRDGTGVIAVKDSGVGIKASDIPHIFERFYRADNSRSKSTADGYGLGLAIAQSIAAAHGGCISVKSKPGQGSVFSLILPL